MRCCKLLCFVAALGVANACSGGESDEGVQDADATTDLGGRGGGAGEGWGSLGGGQAGNMDATDAGSSKAGGGGAGGIDDSSEPTAYDNVAPLTADWPLTGDKVAVAAQIDWESPEKNKDLNGPVWLAAQHLLLFSDSANGRIYQRDAQGKISVWGEFPGKPVGLALQSDKTLVACEVGAKRVVSIDIATKKETTLVDAFNGAAFTGPWDCDVGRDGTVYFTDPNNGAARPIYAAKDGKARLLTNLNWEVGVHLSLDERSIFSPADWPGHSVTQLPLLDSGGVGERVRWADMRREGGAGMCMDRAGDLYVTGIQGVEVFKRKDGSRIGEFVNVNTIAGKNFGHATNCAFGDDDQKTLYITRPEALMKARVNIPGLPD